jgi:hypothetical protein
MNARTFQINVKASQAIAEKILRGLDGKSAVDSEMALLMAYAEICEGIQNYPPETRTRRAWRFVLEASHRLVSLVGEIEAMTVEELDARERGAVDCVATCRDLSARQAMH